MDEEEVGPINRELLDLLRKLAPWAAEEVEKTVRQGKTVPIDLPQRRRTEMGAVVDETKSLAKGKLAITQELLQANLSAAGTRRLLQPRPPIRQCFQSP